MLRSTPGLKEPRFTYWLNQFSSISDETGQITWQRLQDEIVLTQNLSHVFRRQASYGGRIRNLWPLFQFQIFIFAKLQVLRPKLIYACDLDTMLTALVWAKFHKIKIVYDQYDPYSAKVNNRFLKLIFNAVENFFSAFCDLRITANSQRIPARIRSRWTEIPNYYSLNVSTHKSRPTSRILFYGGVLQSDRGLEYVSHAIAKTQEWVFQVYGSGPLFPWIQKIAQTNQNIKLCEPISHEELMHIASTSAAFLALYDPKFGHNISTASNKLYEAAQLGIPLITSSGTYIGNIVNEYKLGIVVDYGNETQLLTALNEVSNWLEQDYENLKINCVNFLRERDVSINYQVVLERIQEFLQVGTK